MPTEDSLLIVIVANTQFNESLQDQVQQLHLKQLHCIMADVSIEKLEKNDAEGKGVHHTQVCANAQILTHPEYVPVQRGPLLLQDRW